jgi:DNA-binding NtrC family response regulator
MIHSNSVLSAQPAPGHARVRSVLIATPDSSLRERLRKSLSGLRWQVFEAPGGAEAWVASQDIRLEALLIDPWLPDLDVAEFLSEFHREHPQVDLLMTDGISAPGSVRSPYHQELRYALRMCQEGDTAAWNLAPSLEETQDLSKLPDLPARNSQPPSVPQSLNAKLEWPARAAKDSPDGLTRLETFKAENTGVVAGSGQSPEPRRPLSVQQSPIKQVRVVSPSERIPELIGNSPAMLEVSRRIRLVAGRSTPVLIEGPTGSGKELVAEALHRLSSRARKAFVAINCAAIPEALLEAELFGHTRGAFTGAVQGRIGRIESADGGTLFLDEIGEMPLALQSKLLRFVESGELQRIGDNETVKVDARIVAATHQPLAEDARKGEFRADLYYRLAVFLIRTPSLAEHMEDIPLLIAHFVERMGRKSPIKRIDSSASAKLSSHTWPGNVRELEHVLERASILSGDDPWITAAEIDFGLGLAN